MSKLNISLTTKKQSGEQAQESNNDDRVVVEFSAGQFERFAAALGLFSDDFRSSLKRAEKEADKGEVARFEDAVS